MRNQVSDFFVPINGQLERELHATTTGRMVAARIAKYSPKAPSFSHKHANQIQMRDDLWPGQGQGEGIVNVSSDDTGGNKKKQRIQFRKGVFVLVLVW